MLVIIQKVASIFIIIAIGFILYKTGVITLEAKKHFSSLLLNVGFPCMILGSITSKTLSDDTMTDTMHTLIIGCVFYVVVIIISFYMSKYLFKFDQEDLGVAALTFPSNNSGLMGFPITLAIFGQDLLYIMVIFNITLTIYINGLGPSLAHLGSKEKGTFSFKKLVKNPSLVAVILAMIMLFTRLHFPAPILDSITRIGDITIALSLIIIGMQLGESDFKKIVKNYKVLIFSLLKMLAIPVVAFLVVNMLDVSTNVKVGIIFGSAFPAAAAAVPIAQFENRNSVLCAEIVALTTLISLATIPIVATLLTNYYGLAI